MIFIFDIMLQIVQILNITFVGMLTTPIPATTGMERFGILFGDFQQLALINTSWLLRY